MTFDVRNFYLLPGILRTEYIATMILVMTIRMLVIALFLLAASNSYAATPSSIEVLRLNRVYPSKTSCDLQTVDFRNFRYFEGEWMGEHQQARPTDPVRVSYGKYSSHEEYGFDDLDVEAVLHPDLGTAVVSLYESYGGGSSNQELVVMVFQCIDGKLTNIQMIHGDGHGRGAGITFSADGKKMIMSSVYDYTKGHCCPRYLEIATFRFANGRYTLVATQEKENH